MTAEPTPFNVMQGEFRIKGQLTRGYCVGVRYMAREGVVNDVLLFAPTRDELMVAAGRISGGMTLYGKTRGECVIAGLEQVDAIPGLDVQEVTEAEWAEATRPGALSG